jgi:membrane-associated phospholipid phosphatase
MSLQNIISISVGLLYIIPLALYFVTDDLIHIKAFVGIIGTTFVSESIKYLLIGKGSVRPKGATDCNLLCTDGNQAGKPGMPSSHSANAAFFSGFYFTQTDNPLIKTILVLYAGLVMLSRYLKRCHTISQIVTGAALGLSISFIMVRQLWCLKKN